MTKTHWATGIVAFLMLGLSVVVVRTAREFPLPMTSGAPGAARLPIVYAVALALVSLALVIATVFNRAEPELEFRLSPRPLALVVWTVLYVLLIPKFGFLAASVPWLGLASFGTGGNWRVSLVTAILLPLAIYLAFVLMLDVPLP